jgi:serine/threonine-protein kinase
MSHIQDTPPPLRQLRPDLPPAIEAVIQRALAKDPAARFRTAAALAQAIERAWPATAAIPGAAGLHDQPTRAWEGAAARPAPAPDRSLAHARPARRVNAALPAPPRPRRSGVSPLLAGVLLAALVIGGIVLLGREAGQLAAPAPTAPALEATPAPEQPTPVPAAQAPAAPEPTVAEPTPAPQPTAPPPTPEPTAAEPTPAPQPTTAPAAPAGPIDELRALLEAGKADGRSGKDGGAMLADLDRARQALADGNEKRATDRLRDLQKRLGEGVKDQQVDSSFAQQALAGITAVADTYGLKLPPIKDNGGDDNHD